MKFKYDYSELDQWLSQHYTENIFDLLIGTMDANIDYDFTVLGLNTSQTMAKLTQIRKLALAIREADNS